MRVGPTRIRLGVTEGCWAFQSWSPERLEAIFMRHIAHDYEPIGSRLTLRAPMVWASRDEVVTTWNTDVGVPWPLDLARAWERIATRIEAAHRPLPWHVLEGVGLDRLLGVANLGNVGRARRGVVQWEVHHA